MARAEDLEGLRRLDRDQLEVLLQRLEPERLREEGISRLPLRRPIVVSFLRQMERPEMSLGARPPVDLLDEREANLGEVVRQVLLGASFCLEAARDDELIARGDSRRKLEDIRLGRFHGREAVLALASAGREPGPR